MALSYINNKEIKFGSAKPLNGVYTPGSPTREYEPLDSLGIYLNSGIPLSYGVENGRYMSMSDEFVATSQGNSYSFNQFFAAQMTLGFKLHDRFIACDTEHKIIGTEPLLHKAYLAEITEKTLDYFKIKIYEEKTRTFCVRMSSSEIPTSYVDLTNSFDENGLNLTQTDRQSFLSYYRFYPLTARDPSSRAEETLGVDYYLLPSAEGLKELSGDILSKFNAFISSDGTLTNLGNTAFAYAGDIGYVPNYRGETSEAAVSAAKKAEVILGRVEEMHTGINQILPKMEENLKLTKQYRDEAMSTEIGTVRTDLDAEINARIEADTALSTKIEVASSVNRYEIENLKAKAEGKLYRTETVEAEAYTVDVPSSVAPYAEVQRIGGKSVVWNQLFKNTATSSLGVTITNNEDGTITLNGTSTYNYINFNSLNKYQNVVGKFLTVLTVLKNTNEIPIKYSWLNRSSLFQQDSIIIGNYYHSFYQNESYLQEGIYTGITGFRAGTVFEDVQIRIYNINLTLMFGEGNEPSLEECKKIFSADYYPYDEGTIKSFPVKRVKSFKADGTEMGNIDISSLTADLKSVGQYHDEWSNGKVTKRIGVVDLGTLIWGVRENISSGFFSSEVFSKAKGLCFTNNYQTQPNSGRWDLWNDCMISHNDGYRGTFTGNVNSNCFIIKDTSKSGMTGAEFKASLNGMLCYYELAEPIEEEVPEIDNYIQVDGGGTLTFESDDTVHMPVPSTDRFVVDLTSTTEEETT